MTSSQRDVSFLERQALKWFGAIAHRPRHPSVVTRRELTLRLRKTERAAVLRAATSGAVGGLVAAGGMRLAAPFAPPEGTAVPWTAELPFLIISIGISSAAAIAELFYLYYDSVRTAARISTLTATHTKAPSVEETRLALVRAGLAIPHFAEPFLTIDPLAEKSRVKLQLWAFLHKTKSSASSFLVKSTVRRIAFQLTGRTLGRAAIALAAVPVFAFWNAYLARKIMVQVRLRALGPLLVDEVLNEVFPDGFEALSPSLQRAFFLAIREEVISVGYFSPTLLLLIAALRPHLDRLNLSDGPPDLANALAHLSPIDGCRVVEFVALLASFDGTSVMAERKTLTRLQRTLGLPPNPERIAAYREMTLEGLPLADAAQGALRPGASVTSARGSQTTRVTPERS